MEDAACVEAEVACIHALVAIAASALLVYEMFLHANFVLDRALEFALPGWGVTYVGAKPLLAGGVSAHDLRLVPPDAAQGEEFRFATLRIDVPFWQYYRSVFSRGELRKLGAIHELRLQFDGGHGGLTQPFTSELAVFGVATAAPFEAQGCSADDLWTEAELPEMGLDARGVQLVLDYRYSGAHLTKEQSLHAPGVGRVAFHREMTLGGESNAVALDEWHVTDEGFVVARNRHCARKDGIDVGQFVARHVDSVKRLLEARGLAPAAELEQAYRTYAASGGRLDLVVHYDPPIGAPLYSADDLGTWLPRLQGTFAAGGKQQTLALRATPLRVLPADDDSPTFVVLQHERESQAPTENAIQPAPADAGATRTSPAAGTHPSGTSSAAAVAQAMPRTGSAITLAGTVANAIQAAPAPSDGRAAAQEAAEPVMGGTLIKYAELARYVGKDLTVYQRGHDPMRVQVLRVADAGDILVRRRFAAGAFDFVLDRKRFDHAEP